MAAPPVRATGSVLKPDKDGKLQASRNASGGEVRLWERWAHVGRAGNVLTRRGTRKGDVSAIDKRAGQERNALGAVAAAYGRQ